MLFTDPVDRIRCLLGVEAGRETFVKRLLLTTVVYSSGPVTACMWKLALPSLRQKPRSAKNREVSTRVSSPARMREGVSLVALRYLTSA